MSKSYRLLGAFLALVVVGALGYMGISYAVQGKGAEAAALTANPIHVRWLLAHQPTDVFANATKVFAATLSKESGGTMVLDVLTPAQVGFTGAGDIPYTQTISYLNQGKAEVSSVYTAAAAIPDPALGVVNLPYLFTNYTSASKVFDSSIGAQLLSAYNASSTVRALAFTYSGGYRIIASDKKIIATPADLVGLHVATSGGQVASAFLTAAGAVPVSLDLESGSSTLSNIDAVETTYSRLSEVVGKNSAYTNYITETGHSLFTTMLVVDDSFYNSLSAADQKALTDATDAAAQVERQDSITLGSTTRAALLSSGSVISTPSTALQAALQAKAETVTAQFTSLFGADTVAAIRSMQQ